jgi:TetR/AcrR family transcriptional repressor of nem operon
MKVSKERRSEHRAAILRVASRLFRERGPEGVSVAEIMQAAGLTHGAFYGHFESKEALLCEVLAVMLAEASDQLRDLGPGGLDDYAQGYVSRSHLDSPGEGCAVAALGGDVARQSAAVRSAFTSGLKMFLDAATETAGGCEDARSLALSRVSQLVGALIVARAVRSSDETLALELLGSITTAE